MPGVRYISQKLFEDEKGSSGKGKSGRVASLGLLAVAISTFAILSSWAVLKGFQQAIRQKVEGFAGQILVEPLPAAKQEGLPLTLTTELKEKLLGNPGVASLSCVCLKPAMIRAGNTSEGVVVKGLNASKDWIFFRTHLLDSLPKAPNQSGVWISKSLANRLQVQLGSSLKVYVLLQHPKVRKLKINGLYETGLEEFDRQFVLTDAAFLQRLAGWTPNQFSTLQIAGTPTMPHTDLAEELFPQLPLDWSMQTVEEAFPQLFDWLRLQDVNVWIILALMLLVAVVNLATIFLVRVIEKSPTIGVLQVLGAPQSTLRGIFSWQSLKLSLRGLAWGNALFLLLYASQVQWHWIPLDQASYYVSYVPMWLPFPVWGLLNIGILLVSNLSMRLPARVLRKQQPLRNLSFRT